MSDGQPCHRLRPAFQDAPRGRRPTPDDRFRQRCQGRQRCAFKRVLRRKLIELERQLLLQKAAKRKGRGKGLAGHCEREQAIAVYQFEFDPEFPGRRL